MSKQRTQGPGQPDASRAPAPLEAAPAGAVGAPACGITLEQLDTLDRLLRAIAAHGDVLASVQASALAPGTLPVIGQAVQEHAQSMRDVLDRVEAQRPGRPHGRRGEVEEVRAGYAPVALRLVADGPSRAVAPVRTPASATRAA